MNSSTTYEHTNYAWASEKLKSSLQHVCLYLCLQTQWAWLQSSRGGRRVQRGGGREEKQRQQILSASPLSNAFSSLPDGWWKISQNWGNKNRFQIRVDVRWLILIFWSNQQKYSFSISQTYEIILKLHRLQYLWLPNSCDTISSIAGTNTDCTNSL